ncbi:hypothetical protein Aperf_G00000080964 [Anoplocephala perfoliata]
MVKLTVDLVEGAMQYTNPLKDRELDLRDNEIRKLDNFPLLRRLRSLIFTANKIIRIGEDLVSSLPNLETLILTDNNITELKDLDPLISLSKLTFLSLVRCPVTLKMNYRLYVIGRMPQLRFLDFKRITLAERTQAQSFVKHLVPITKTDANGINNKPKAGSVKTFVPGAPVGKKAASNEEHPEGARSQEKSSANEQPREFPQATLHAGVKRVMLSGGNSQDLMAIQDAIKKARTMDEVERLHQMLNSGQFAGFAAHWHKQQQQQQ